ncbi:tol-pal system protein YbgF [Ferrimonas sp. SCSIO 43195]|uniref:tol-pal system protein YbgF n=1 Tax=Ferrimonas sp. SCSIO 43195 TaxID=2822844 RepID=UPI0020751072|nr:tol-pal system protein YbgF [Ferrimonas sp. SCSIO 43195]USD36233.1 tol-pal system protein YbgF [Ferrimonas sp. SCSIO 43195]
MKKAVIATALLFMGAQLQAAPAPVIEAAENTSPSLSGTDLNSRVSRLERLMKARNQAQLQMQQMFDQLQAEVSELRGQIESQQYQVQQMVERQRQLYQELSRIETQLKSGASLPSAGTPASGGSAAVATPNLSLSEAEAYQQAVDLVLKQRRYDDAIPAFRQFIENYPQSSYTANSHYWLGQLLFNKGELTEAKTAFNTVVSQYPDSAKRADSLLKLGLIAAESGDKAGATQYFNRVVKEYGNSNAAKLAKKELSKG